MREELTPIRFPRNLQFVLDLEEKQGVPKENIPSTVDIVAEYSDHVDSFEEACAESTLWVDQYSKRDQYDLISEISGRFVPGEIEKAPITINRMDYSHQNPLKFALGLQFPIRLTLLILALFRQYGSGGEAVNIGSELPPMPPAPGHWGGSTPGFEQPLPVTDEDLNVGDTKRSGR